MAKLTHEELDELDLEFFLERESVPYKLGRGVSGEQLHIQNCPACHDTRWRTYFGTENGKGNCFVCNAKFSKATFIHNYYGHTDNEWSATFREIEQILKEQGWRPKRAAMVRIEVTEVVLPISTPLPSETGEYLDYLSDRSIPPEIAQYFGLRHCQHGWWKFKREGKTEMQNFSNRLIIPVTELDGSVKTFQGRDLLGLSDRKYLFPIELPGTGRYLLNGHNCLATKRACMGEGAFDVMAIKIAMDEGPDLRDVVALGSFGKHLSYGDPAGNDQLGRFHALKQRGLQEVTIMWDGEAPALKAAIEAAKKLITVGLKVRIALLPYEKDPNEILPEQVRRAFYAAKPYSPALAMQWLVQNPYSTPALRKKHGL